MLILYLAVVITALYCVSRILLPEMIKPVPKTVSGSKPDISSGSGNRIEKLEILLVEKNKNIGLLQTELKVFCAQVRDFDKVRSLLEEEIHRLREQNRIFRSELGLPTTQHQENSVA